MDDTWATREVPVLAAVVALLEESYMVTVSDVADRTGLPLDQVSRSLSAMHPTYVDFRRTETGGDPRFWYVLKVTPAARRAVGQWPTAEDLIDRLTAAFIESAKTEPDPETRGRLQVAADLLGGPARQAAIRAAEGIVDGAVRPAQTRA